ncbi:hypothetical protein [Allosalinactinospora lopnorensis]|uniref:hypothetical protein n=1 Tax=Allosalinactinospora lopnorensis TaxID=1352348 RepID=UPI000623D6BF|nr:hypothetical protein [Allosalinactinospora lopnorensis]
MSWDVLLLRLPGNVTSVRHVPDGYEPPPLGSRQHVTATLRRAVPGADLSDPTRGGLLGPGWSMELGIGASDPVESVMLHIRGSGDDVLPHVFRMAAALDCKVLDCSAGDLITAQEASGWHAFQTFRDHAVGPPR